MSYEERINRICHSALMEFGVQSQVDMAIEECSELINALEKYRRGLVGNADVCTEIADVVIMCKQMGYIFGESMVSDEIERKINRLDERIESYHKKRISNGKAK